MQDFTRYSYKLNSADLERAAKEYGGTVLIIINGEYYEYSYEPDTEPKKEFWEV